MKQVILSNLALPYSSFFKKWHLLFLITFTVLLGSGCAKSIFDQQAVSTATELKNNAIALISKATTGQFDAVKEEANTLKTALQAALDYEKARKKNTESIALWQKMIDPKQKMLGGFLEKWEKTGIKPMNKNFVAEAQKLIGKGFDQIIELENKKSKPK